MALFELPSVKSFEFAPGLRVGDGCPLLLIAGPCQIESLEHCLKIAEFLQTTTRDFPVQLVFKSSFDKANRTSGSSQRGPGIEAGLKILQSVKEQSGLPILTDLHSLDQTEQVAAHVDILQIPAFLCRQTDLLQAAGETGKPIHLKKGQFLHPADMAFAAQKIASTGNDRILLCERGSCFGYRDLVVDMRSLIWMREAGYPIVFDATHSVQSMGGAGGSSGGSRQFVSYLSCAAAAVGIHGLFLECHDDPDNAPSDGPNMIPLADLSELLERVCAIRQAFAQ